MQIFLNQINIVLASASPRRRELLANLGVNIRIAETLPVDESFPPNMNASDVAEYISNKKADAYRKIISADETLVTADTMVICHGAALGKPSNENEAREMLHLLSGRTHMVTTGVTLLNAQKRISFSETTEVDFSTLTDNEINYYIEKYRPLDKAGAYGIQEWIGYIGIEGIRGDYYNVMGMPLHALYRNLKKLYADSSPTGGIR